MSKVKVTEAVFNIRVPRDLAESIHKIADAEFEKPTTIIRRLIRNGLQMYDEKQQTIKQGQ